MAGVYRNFGLMEGFSKISSKIQNGFLTENTLLNGHRKPSHDIFRCIFMRFDGPAFSILLGAWLEHSVEKNNPKIRESYQLGRVAA